MTIVEITGGMLRAARSLTGLSQQELAERASISRPCLTAWEGSSGSVPNAKAGALQRVVAALEAEGIEFRPKASICSSVLRQPGPSFTAREPWHEPTDLDRSDLRYCPRRSVARKHALWATGIMVAMHEYTRESLLRGLNENCGPRCAGSNTEHSHNVMITFT
jgi:transcriptional regulator with XRE-family HTH domain